MYHVYSVSAFLVDRFFLHYFVCLKNSYYLYYDHGKGLGRYLIHIASFSNFGPVFVFVPDGEINLETSYIFYFGSD